jgi:hypothetical protein
MIAALTASYAVALPQMPEEKSFCPAFGRSDSPAGETDERRPSDQEMTPHTLVNFARRLLVNLGSPLTC